MVRIVRPGPVERPSRVNPADPPERPCGMTPHDRLVMRLQRLDQDRHVVLRPDVAKRDRRVPGKPTALRPGYRRAEIGVAELLVGHAQDRKSTRLNSSHVQISYAVFCMKKKNMMKTLTYFQMKR